jgi:ribosomal protein RSM22 (predicted rRNA methylase)
MISGIQLPENGDLPSDLGRSIVALSQRFTRARGPAPLSYLDDASLRRAYLAYYVPVNLQKVQSLLDEMPSPSAGTTLTGGMFRVLDVGGGPGTAGLGVLDWALGNPALQGHTVEVVAVDRSAMGLREYEALWRTYARLVEASPANLLMVQADLEQFNPSAARGVGDCPYDLIIIANTLNELFSVARDPIRKRVELLRDLLGLLDQNGTLMIIEPALRETSRQLHLVRDRLLEEHLCTVYSPCLHECPCPALLKETDWCHEERPWTPPPLVAAIDRQVGFIKDALKFAYLLLRKDGKTVVERRPDVYRVVSELRSMKGEKRAWLCNETGRPEVGRLDRMRSPSNAAFDEWHRGAIVRIDEIVRKNQKATIGRVPVEATVEIVRPV